MNQFSISQLSQFSGIKPHTIRIWEQRYGALEPKRTEGNTRLYDGEQLRRLLNIVSLSRTQKISKICAMTNAELFEVKSQYLEQAAEEDDFSYFVNDLISAGLNYDEIDFENIFSNCVDTFGFTTTYKKVLYPVLVKVGLMWTANFLPPSQEHFLSNLIKQKIYAAIDSLKGSEATGETWLLCLPEDEFHEVGLLFGNYFLRSHEQQVIYLGANVPLSTLEETLENVEINNILTFFVRQNAPENFERYIEELLKISENRNIYVAGDEAVLNDLDFFANVHKLTSLEELEEKFYLNQDS